MRMRPSKLVVENRDSKLRHVKLSFEHFAVGDKYIFNLERSGDTGVATLQFSLSVPN